MKKLFTISLMLVAMLSFNSCSEKMPTTTPGEIALLISEKTLEGDTEAVFEMIDFSNMSSVDAEMTQAAMAEMFKQAQPIADAKGGLISNTVVEEVISEDGLSATVVLETVYGDNSVVKTPPAKYIVVDGEWKLAL